MLTIPETIAINRKTLGLTQRQLGEACGYEGRTAEVMVQHWEKGRSPVPLDKIRILAKTLQISIDSLIP